MGIRKITWVLIISMALLATGCRQSPEQAEPEVVHDEPATAEFNHLEFNEDYQEADPKIIERFPAEGKTIALTFDDWASDETVSEVLSILREYGVHSTFFLIGEGVERNPQLARIILENGHEIANHSYTHPELPGLSIREIQEQVIRTDEVLTEAIGQAPANYVRPPRGKLDHETAQKVTAAGVDYIIQVGVSSDDWNPALTDQEVCERVMDGVQPGSIITMHILDNAHTVRVLPEILDWLIAQGYEFRTVGEMISESGL
ncbi:polysaccharide deacetylase family protein [Bhargavaea changchunensis]|uniref:Polysaccharide deacetylase family protein n=2 Tax=Bhargavaea changchunensis TaxID=2134037 RepID=A0ABW2NHA2_9BACL|nr:polysaccharide deacetylase family protein [Bhargavaea sp. CC-171006]